MRRKERCESSGGLRSARGTRRRWREECLKRKRGDVLDKPDDATPSDIAAEDSVSDCPAKHRGGARGGSSRADLSGSGVGWWTRRCGGQRTVRQGQTGDCTQQNITPSDINFAVCGVNGRIWVQLTAHHRTISAPPHVCGGADSALPARVRFRPL
ncbi:hypothetical protein C8R47DRAFT_156096 [Mycena vitilis]|nr:hypothetical protein C8R47DRAFT_156096 [Mycena vitilis]